MRMMIILLAILALALMAACAPVGGDVEPAMEAGETGDAPALNPVAPDEDASDSYPAASADEGYPAPDDVLQSAIASGYPVRTLVAPSGEVDVSQLTPIAPEDTTPRVAPAPGRPGATPNAQMSLLLEAAVLDLSAQAGVAVEEVTVVSVEPVVWPNGGLGCPQEGMAYAEVLVEGSLITMKAGGQTYTYHTGGANEYVLCQDGVRVSGGVVPMR